LLDDALYLCPKAAIIEAPEGLKAGTVFGCSDEGIRVATREGGVELRELLSLDGRSLKMSDVIERHLIADGLILPELGNEERDRLTKLDGSLCKHESFWVERLKALVPAPIPYLESSEAKKHDGSALEIPIPAEIEARLKGWDPPADRQEFLLAAFAFYLSRLSGEEIFPLGVRRKRRAEGEGVADILTARVVPLTVEADSSRSFRSHFSDLRRELERTLEGVTFLLDVAARYPELAHLSNHELAEALAMQVELVDQLGDEAPDTNFAVRLVVPAGRGKCRLRFDSEVLGEEKAQMMAEQFVTWLRGIVTNGDSTLLQLPILSDEEGRTLLETWNATTVELPGILTMHGSFEAQVAATPDAVAVLCRDEEVTYAELNARANQLARYLRKLGVGPDTLVGICVERSTDMVVGLLGIL
ncbi:MAG: AMP-binding protein, partial [Nitrospirota bacterium]|nr:AMP-binding protein [Nitrospirota bacterium]